MEGEVNAQKRCSKCGIARAFPQEFFRDNRIKCGYRSACKQCDVSIARSPEAIKRGSEARKDKCKQSGQSPRRHLTRGEPGYAEYAQKKAIKDKRYRQSAKGRLTKLRAKSKRKARGGAHALTVQEWDVLLEAFGHACAYCGEMAGKLTVDHIVPLSRGGDTVIENVVPACHNCNSSKQAHAVEQWCNPDRLIEILTILDTL